MSGCCLSANIKSTWKCDGCEEEFEFHNGVWVEFYVERDTMRHICIDCYTVGSAITRIECKLEMIRTEQRVPIKF